MCALSSRFVGSDLLFGCGQVLAVGTTGLTALMVRHRKYTRNHVTAELKLREVTFNVHERVAELKELLIQNLSGAMEGAAPAPSGSQVGDADTLVGLCKSSGYMDVTRLQLSVRRLLNPECHELPKCEVSINKILVNLRQLQAHVCDDADPPLTLYRCVKECLHEDAVVQKKMMNALLADIEARIVDLKKARLSTVKQAPQAAVRKGHPVLVQLGDAGRDRYLYEYSKVYMAKKTRYQQAALFPIGPNSYLSQLMALLRKRSESVHELAVWKEVGNIKALRDLLAGWCLFYSHVKAPFINQNGGIKTTWTREVWEALPLIQGGNDLLGMNNDGVNISTIYDTISDEDALGSAPEISRQ
jgi:hypothetical protein